MPVDLSVPNSIIAAYAQGRAEAFQRKQQADILAQQQIENEQKQQALDEQRRQFDEAQKQAETHFNITQEFNKNQFNVQKALAALQFQQQSEKTGLPVPGTTQLQETPSLLDTGIRQAITGPDLGGLQYEYRTPQKVAQDTAAAGVIERAPIRAENIADYRQKTEIDEGSQKNLINLKDSNLTTHDKLMLSLESAAKERQSNIDYLHKLGEIDENMKWEYAIRGGSTFEPWTALPIDPKTQNKLKLPEGSTWADLGVNSLDEVGQKKFQTYNEMELYANKAIDLFKDLAATKVLQGQFPDTVQGRRDALTSAYGEYFTGPGKGTVQDLFPNATATELTNTVKPILGRIATLQKILSEFGSSFTANEEKLQKSYTLGGERSINPDTAIKILEGLAAGIPEARLSVVQTHGKGKGGGGIEKIKIPAPGGNPLFPGAR